MRWYYPQLENNRSSGEVHHCYESQSQGLDRLSENSNQDAMTVVDLANQSSLERETLVEIQKNYP